VDATIRPSEVPITAASSPGPSRVLGATGSPAMMRRMTPNSPSSETVMTLAPRSQYRCLRYVLPVPTTQHERTRTPMSVNAYILIQTEVGQAASVAREIGALAGVTMAEDVTGPYDVIVRAEAESVDELGKLVVARVQAVPGITRTLTCPVVYL
jgi:DNA-binding Lrp family transcriptional regulator